MTPPGPLASRPATVLRLLLGRGMFRLGVQAMSAVLVTVWDQATFGAYANALGVCLSLSLVSTAAEKAALKVLPRTRLLTGPVAGVVLVVSAAPAVVLLALLVPVLVVAPFSAAALYLAAATLAVCTGHLMAVAGLHRLRGHPMIDTVAFSVVGCVLLAVTAATWLVGWAPQIHLVLIIAGVLVVIVVALAALPRTWVRPPRGPRRPLAKRLMVMMWLLGVSDLLDALSTSVIYLALALAGRTAESGPLYLVLLVGTAICQVAVYLMRIAAPETSRRLRGTGGDAGRRRALGLMRRAEVLGAAAAVMLAGAYAVPTVRSRLAEWQPVVLALLGLLEVVLFVTVLYGSYLLENTNSAMLAVTARGAAAGLCAVALLAAALVPTTGATGAMAALALAVAVKAFVLRRLLLRARPELRAAPAPI